MKTKRLWEYKDDGRESTEDDKHTGRPVTITTEKKVAEIQEFILEDRRVTVETVARHLTFRMVQLRTL